MSSQRAFVVVGGGLAAAKAVETLRSEGFDGSVTVIGREPQEPYHRPPLSKGYLAGSEDRASLNVHDSSWYEQNQVELILGSTANHIDPTTREVSTDSGQRYRFDKLLIATGSQPRKLDVPGSDLDGIHYLRRVGDSDDMKSVLGTGGRRIVIVGGGWIGLEVAANARLRGNDVTVIEPQTTVLSAALGPEMGEVFAGLHRDRGVRLILGDGVRGLTGVAGRVASVELESGAKVPADEVVIGVGAQPEVDLASRADLEVDNGIVVDPSLRTGHPDIYAAGDVANAHHPLLGRRIRVEHWTNALHTGPAAARAMLGQDVSYDRLPFFFTDQYDLGMEYVGHIGPDGYDQVVVRGDVSGLAFLAFWLKERRILAGMHVNTWGTTDAIEALVRAQRTIDPNALADDGTSLEDIADA